LKHKSFPYLNPSIPKFAIPQFGANSYYNENRV